MRYIPHTKEDVTRLLGVCGLRSVEELFQGIPERLRMRSPLSLAEGLTEPELLAELSALAAKNRVAPRTLSQEGGLVTFLGAGAPRHIAPSALDQLLLRSEFYTSYTPYQPEISQGTLQAIFEFQTIVAELFSLDVANASMYDGASAAAEAALMARRLTGRGNVLASAGVHPEYRQTIVSSLQGLSESELVSPVTLEVSGATDLAALDRQLAASDPKPACVLVQSPNFYGVIEDYASIVARAHKHGTLVVGVCAEPVALGLLRSPGEAGCDIAVGEGLGLCGHTSLGGPGVGLFATRTEHIRQMPGRLVGETVDAEGRRGYVLTLATREQHIRRDRATSNICTNQGLMALAFTIQLCLLGRAGFRQLAQRNLELGEYAKQKLNELPGHALRFSGPTFNELAVKVACGDADKVVAQLGDKNIVPGVALGRFSPEFRDTLLVAVNELHRRADIDRLASAMAEVR